MRTGWKRPPMRLLKFQHCQRNTTVRSRPSRKKRSMRSPPTWKTLGQHRMIPQYSLKQVPKTSKHWRRNGHNVSRSWASPTTGSSAPCTNGMTLRRLTSNRLLFKFTKRHYCHIDPNHKRAKAGAAADLLCTTPMVTRLIVLCETSTPVFVLAPLKQESGSNHTSATVLTSFDSQTTRRMIP